MPSAYFRNGGSELASGTNLTNLNATTGITLAWWTCSLRVGLQVGDVFRHTSTANSSRDGYRFGFSSTGGLNLRICGSTTSSDTQPGALSFHHSSNRWLHWAITFDDSTNLVRCYRNGMMVAIGTNTADMTANASCTTQVPDSGLQGRFIGYLFDVQVLPNFVARPADMPMLMNPRHTMDAVRGRYFGVEFAGAASGSLVFDESGNGNNLTASGIIVAAHEPPFLPTYQ